MTVKQKNIIVFWIIVFAIIVLNILASVFYKRIDLTQDKRYTLSPYTKQVLSQLDGQVHVTVYLSGRDLPVRFKHFRMAVKDLLDEFKLYMGKRFSYDFVNPLSKDLPPDQKKKLYDEFRTLGIVPLVYQEVSNVEAKQIQVFPSAKITFTSTKNDSVLRQEVGLNLLNKDPNFEPASQENINNSEQTLEYKFVKVLLSFIAKKSKTVAFTEGHGELPEPFVLAFEKELSQYYNVQRGVIGGRYDILDSFSVVIIAKPLERFSKADKFVLDQYLMKGGSLLFLLDGVKVGMDSIIYYNKAFAFPALVSEIDLEDMLFRYGVRVNSDLIQDLFCSTIRLVGEAPNGQKQYHTFLWPYFPVLVTQNNHVINKYIDYIHTNFISSIDTIGRRPGLKRTILLTTSEFSRKIPVSFPYEITLDEVNHLPPKQLFTQRNIPVAVLLEGQFKSAFAGRIVKDLLPKNAQFLPKSKPAKMIVVADGDIIRNEVSYDGKIMPLGFDHYSGRMFNGNKQFLINAVNYLAGDQGIMKLRSRQFTLRVLDKEKIASKYLLWVSLALVLPLLIMLALGFLAGRIKF